MYNSVCIRLPLLGSTIGQEECVSDKAHNAFTECRPHQTRDGENVAPVISIRSMSVERLLLEQGK